MTPENLSSLDACFQPFARSDAPGLVVGVAHHGRTVYRRGFGLASVELGVTNSPATRMRIASTSKHFTALAALLLQEEGRLDLDAGVRRYIPELPALAAEPTLRQLLTHTSGYRCYLDLGLISDAMAIPPKGSVLAAQVRQTEANFLPAEKFIYSNSGYHLVSIVVDRISGMPFEQFLQQRIFAPLGMWDTQSVPGNFELLRGMATLHVPGPDGSWRRGIWPSEELRGEGGIVSTVDDMLAWLAHLRAPDKIIGSAESWRQLMQPATLGDGSVCNYALGLIREDYRGLQVIHHAGSVFGGTCQMLTAPDAGLDIVIMTNGVLANPGELALKVVDALASDRLTAGPTARAAAQRFRPMIGRRYFSSAAGTGFSFAEVAEERLGLSFMNFLPMPLKEHSGGQDLTLGIEEVAVGPLSFRTSDLAESGDAPQTLRFWEGSCVGPFEQMPAQPPELARVAEGLVGRYRAADLGADAEMRFADGKLRLRIAGGLGGNDLELEAWSADVLAWSAISFPLLRGLISVERDEAGRMQGLRLDTIRTRGLRFKRLAS